MRALVIPRHGGPDVLASADLPRPDPLPTEVLVRVVAAGVNPVDWRIREGQVLGAHRDAFGKAFGELFLGDVRLRGRQDLRRLGREQRERGEREEPGDVEVEPVRQHDLEAGEERAGEGGELERPYTFGIARQLLETTLRRLPEATRQRLIEGPAAMRSLISRRTCSMTRMATLQIDSVNVYARSHYMPLFSRLGPYDTRVPERMVVETRGWAAAVPSIGDLVRLTTGVIPRRTVEAEAVPETDAAARRAGEAAPAAGELRRDDDVGLSRGRQ